MSSLLKKHQEFKKSVATQQVYAKPIVNPSIRASLSTTSSSLGTSSGYGNDATNPMNRHALSMLYSIINHLKHVQRPQTKEDIQKFTRTVIDEGLEQQLKINEKIIFNPEIYTFEYKPVFDIRNKDDLLEFLKKRANTGGLAVKDLKDSYIDLSSIIEELKQEARILTIDNKDGSPRILFYNKMPMRVNVDPEFQQVWLELKVPDETALGFEMERAGLKQMEMEKRKLGEDEGKKAKTKNRKIKITNTHLEGIDLTKDYVPEKK